MKRAAKHVVLKGSVQGVMRTAVFEEKEHLVVPVVMLVEGVVHAVNSETPELVLAEELERAPQGWNGRPVLPDHPSKSGERVSANDPKTLEESAFGRVFNARVQNKRLLGEAWLDQSRAEKIGGDAQRTIQRLNAGELIEVSVGAFVVSEDRAGVWNGEPFRGVWTDIVPDHLAMLPEGTVGACSVEAGCGAPRAAERGGKVTLKEKIAALRERFQARQAEEIDGQTDADLRDMLHEVLFASEPAFLGIEAVMPDESIVIFAVAPEGEVKMFKQTFARGEGGVTLEGDKQEVTRVMKFETVDEGTPDSRAAEGCGCGKPAREASVDKKELVKAVLARKGTPFVEADAKLLEGFSEERLKALAEPAVEAPAPVAPPAPAPKPEPVVEAKALTPEEEEAAFYSAHPDVKAVVDESKARAAARKTELVAAIGATKQDVYKPEELQGMDVPALERTLKLLSVNKPKTDFSPLAPRVAEETDAPAPPPSLHAAIREARGMKTSN